VLPDDDPFLPAVLAADDDPAVVLQGVLYRGRPPPDGIEPLLQLVRLTEGKPQRASQHCRAAAVVRG
jgi:hypothetical protein